jgi:hypothetical protein
MDGKREDAPAHARKGKTGSLGNLEAFDCLWTSEDGTLDVDEVLKESSWTAERPLEALLLAIVEGNPSEGRETDSACVEIALAALTGRKRKRGRKKLHDFDLLVRIGRLYLDARWQQPSHSKQTIDLAPLIKRVLSQ